LESIIDDESPLVNISYIAKHFARTCCIHVATCHVHFTTSASVNTFHFTTDCRPVRVAKPLAAAEWELPSSDTFLFYSGSHKVSFHSNKFYIDEFDGLASSQVA
jgi:hypothetical protein